MLGCENTAQQSLLLINVQQSVRAILFRTEQLSEQGLEACFDEDEELYESLNVLLERNVEAIGQALTLAEQACGYLPSSLSQPVLQGSPEEMLGAFRAYCLFIENLLSQISHQNKLDQVIGSGQLATEEAIQDWLASAASAR